jgi:hypothetical protein
MKCVRTTVVTLIAITSGALLISNPAGANPAASGAAMLVDNQSRAFGLVQPTNYYGYGYRGYGRGYYGGYGRGYYGGYGRGYYGGYGGYGRGYYGGYGGYGRGYYGGGYGRY